MKHWMKRLTAAALALSFLTSQGALASDALGHDLHAAVRPLSEGTKLSTGWFWSDTYGDLRTERYLTYTPNEAVKPTVAYGDTVLSRATLSAMAQGLEAQGKRVVGGSNGDFYVLATGEPLGLVVTDGVLRSSSSYLYAVGFRADGSALVGQPQLRVTATLGGERVSVTGGVNKVRQLSASDGSGGLTLLTPDFASDTKNTKAGVDVTLQIVTEGVGEDLSAEESGAGQALTVSDRLRIGGRVRCRVVQVAEATGASPIPADGFVLTMNGADSNTAVLEKLRALQAGDEVTIDVTSADPAWNQVTQAIGGLYRLLENGQVGSGLSTERTARTAIGVKADGTVIFYTIDGKQPGKSIGATFTQVAQRLLELGCVDAVGLDGGGSTTLGVTCPDQNAFGVVNSPADGAQRANTNAIFLTTELKPTGEPMALSLAPGDVICLAGAQVSFTATALDTAWYDMGPIQDVFYTAAGAGQITREGLFTAGAAAGGATVTGTRESLAATGLWEGLTGQAAVTVVDTPDQITVTDEATGGTVSAIALEPGERISLTASAAWRGLSLVSQDGCYRWSCDAAVGSVDAQGTFTAGSERASGTLTVTAGGKSLSIPVNVAGHVTTLADMEGTTLPFASSEGAQAAPETGLDHVRTGYQSLRVDYDTGLGPAILPADGSLPAGERYLGLWVYGDGSGHSLTATVTNGQESGDVELTRLDFTGWRHVLAALPWEGARLTVLTLAGEGPATGTIWLDQLTSANERIEDFTPPTITLKAAGGTLTASVEDNIDKEFPAERVEAFCDGKKLESAWNVSTGTLTAAIPAGAGVRRLTVTATDASGNTVRQSLDVGEGEPSPFSDMTDHWAGGFASYLYAQGVTNGVQVGENLEYQPGDDITRAEFFTMAARWLGLDQGGYEEVALPFADADAIPGWALNALKAMYQQGIVRGSLENGALYAHPNATITRAEAMTILGRTQRRGYPEADLSAFSDQDQVPGWAAPYVASLVGQKVVGGYTDGTLRPSAAMTRGEVAKVLYALR